MITLTRGIGDRNEGRGEEERVFVSSLFLPVPRIPFLPDARNLQPSVFFFRGHRSTSSSLEGKRGGGACNCAAPFFNQPSFLPFLFFFLSVSTDKRYFESFFRSVQIRGRRAYERVCAKGKVGEKFRGRREGEMGQGSKLRFAGKEEREGKKGGKGEGEGGREWMWMQEGGLGQARMGRGAEAAAARRQPPLCLEPRTVHWPSLKGVRRPPHHSRRRPQPRDRCTSSRRHRRHRRRRLRFCFRLFETKRGGDP